MSTISAAQGHIAVCVSFARMGARCFDRCDFLLPFCSHKKGEKGSINFPLNRC